MSKKEETLLKILSEIRVRQSVEGSLSATWESNLSAAGFSEIQISELISAVQKLSEDIRNDENKAFGEIKSQFPGWNW